MNDNADQIGGKRRYPTNNAPAVTMRVEGSEDVIVFAVAEAMGFATSMIFVVCCAAPAIVCRKEK